MLHGFTHLAQSLMCLTQKFGVPDAHAGGAFEASFLCSRSAQFSTSYCPCHREFWPERIKFQGPMHNTSI